MQNPGLMTPWIKRNNEDTGLKAGIRKEPYIQINLILAGVILLIFVYSGLFSPQKDNYPVVCIHEKLTGQPCVSCGLSHSFSLILRGRISEAYKWNEYGLRVFIFFAAQLIMRVVFSLFYMRNKGTRKQLIIYDSAISFMLFFVCFKPFIESIFRFL